MHEFDSSPHDQRDAWKGALSFNPESPNSTHPGLVHGDDGTMCLPLDAVQPSSPQASSLSSALALKFQGKFLNKVRSWSKSNNKFPFRSFGMLAIKRTITGIVIGLSRTYLMYPVQDCQDARPCSKERPARQCSRTLFTRFSMHLARSSYV